MFWRLQSDSDKAEYIKMLQIVGSLSKLFSDSSTPYLYYRAHENLFCKVFDAKNLSRGDIAYDAIKGNIGIGLKTFLNGNGKTFQKIAEFNSNSHEIRQLKTAEEIIIRICELRNKRLKVTENMTGASDRLYHLITREEGKMNVVETPMEKIDISSIKIYNKQSENTIKFKDKYNDYSFSLSKNVLSKRFDSSEGNIIKQFNVNLLTDPFQILKDASEIYSDKQIETLEYIILPLYSETKGQAYVPEKSGLNQWNASGRKRDINEVYIRIPSWIHKTFSDFFVYTKNRLDKNESGKNHPSFNVELTNGKILSCKVAQAGGKALMSDPNNALGLWILREVLKLDNGQLVTMEMLNEIGIDSVKLSKKNDDYYYLDFMDSGSYVEFELNNKL